MVESDMKLLVQTNDSDVNSINVFYYTNAKEMKILQKHSKIYVAGHNGMVGSAIVRALKNHGFSDIIVRSSKELNLTRQNEVENFFTYEKPEYVFLAAAKVGGIYANSTYPAEFIYDNLMIECNVIHASYQNKVRKLLFLGSSCIYPKLSPQPIKKNTCYQVI